MNKEIQKKKYEMSKAYRNYMDLLEYYEDTQCSVSKNDLKRRYNYLKNNNKIKQRTEQETLKWILGVEDE